MAASTVTRAILVPSAAAKEHGVPYRDSLRDSQIGAAFYFQIFLYLKAGSIPVFF